jgi:PhoPQ-activated pathogenicity-related protein
MVVVLEQIDRWKHDVIMYLERYINKQSRLLFVIK